MRHLSDWYPRDSPLAFLLTAAFIDDPDNKPYSCEYHHILPPAVTSPVSPGAAYHHNQYQE